MPVQRMLKQGSMECTHTSTKVIPPKDILIFATFISSFGINPLGESSGINIHFGSARKVQSHKYVAKNVFVASRRKVCEADAVFLSRYWRMMVVIMVIVMERSTAHILLVVRRVFGVCLGKREGLHPD